MKKNGFICAMTAAAMIASVMGMGYVFAEEKAIRIEFEDQIESNADFTLSETADGGKMAGISRISTGSYSYTVTFNAETAGEYNMQIAAAAYAYGITESYSDVSWSLNGSEPLSLNESSLKYNLDDSGTTQRTLFALNEKIDLLEGENTLTLSGGRRSGSPMVVFSLDYASFTTGDIVTPNPTDEPTVTSEPAPNPTLGPEGVLRLEVEDISSEFIVEDANVSGGKFQIYKSTDTSDVVQRFEVNVEESGEYTLSFACANYSNMEFLSQLYFSVNGGDYIEINSSECGSSQLEELADTSQQGTFGLYKYTYNQPVTLEAGSFTIDIKAVQRINIAPGAGIYFSFDYIEIEEAKETEPTLGSGRVEAEDISSNSIVNDANVSGGRYQLYRSADTTDVVQRFSFRIDNTGDYTVSVAAGTFAKMSYLSALYISINGGQYMELNEDNCYITQLPELADTGLRATYNLYDHVYKNDLHLSEGITTIDVKATARTNTAATPGVYYSLDYVEVMPVKQLTGLYGMLDKGYIVCGDDEQMRIFNDEDRELTAADITSVDYTVEDERIASIDQNGVIHGRNYGSTVIRADIDRKGVKASMEYTVYVTDDTGLYMTDAARDGDRISVTVNSPENYDGTHKIFVCVYGNEDGYPTSVKSMSTAEICAMARGESRTVEVDTVADSADIVGLFIVDENMRAVCGKIIL